MPSASPQSDMGPPGGQLAWDESDWARVGSGGESQQKEARSGHSLPVGPRTETPRTDASSQVKGTSEKNPQRWEYSRSPQKHLQENQLSHLP